MRGLSICSSLLLLSALAAVDVAAEDFSGNWVVRLGPRPFMVLVLSRSAKGDAYVGWLARPKHFSADMAGAVSGITGGAVRYDVVGSAIAGDCLRLTTRHPVDKSDDDTLRLCPRGAGRGTLGPDVPGFEPWPVAVESEAATIASDWANRPYRFDDSDAPCPEMQRIFEEDQKARLATGKIDWELVAKSDAERRRATANLLAEGRLQTGGDFRNAAFVFQHGDTPDDYLLAHTLAVVAVARGESEAVWIASATLDRYLQSIHRPQIYGTQFNFEPGKPTTQEPYDRALVSDGLRRVLSVPSQAAQEEQRKQYDHERSSP